MNSRKTVLVQLNSLGLRGTEINAVDLAAAVRPHGYDSVLIAPADTMPEGPSLFDVAAERGVRLEAYERPHTVLQGARILNRRSRELRADIVHIYGPWSARSAYWGPSLLGRRPLILTDYEMSISPDTFRAPYLIVGTGYLLDEQADRYGPTSLISPPVDLPRDRSEVVNGAAFRAELGIGPDQIAAIIVSRLDTTMKALPIMSAIKAMERVDRSDLVLVIVGTGDAADRLQACARAANDRIGRPVVVFAGSRSDPRPAYASADLALGMGGSASRALAFGKPLIVHGEGGCAEIFTPQSATRLYRNSFWSSEMAIDPVSEVSELMRELVDNPKRRLALGLFGREFAESHYGLKEMAVRLARCYRIADTTYNARSWAHDLDLELLAAAHRLTPRRKSDIEKTAPSAYRFKAGRRGQSIRSLSHRRRKARVVSI
jgi:glycosyltransferase involved in cell wall biosynthesis